MGALLEPLTSQMADYLGIGLGLTAAACWAAYILINRVVGERVPGAAGPATAAGVSALGYLPVGVWVLAGHPASVAALGRAAAAGLLCSAVPMTCDLLALRRVTARFFGVFMSSNPVLRQKDTPTLAKSDEALDKFVDQIVKADDANDFLYALDASRDYDPGPSLEKIRASLLAINSADDLINPPELGILEREIKRVPHGRAMMIPFSDKTRGHGSHTVAALWKDELIKLLQDSKIDR